jgi:hypothetical protein
MANHMIESFSDCQSMKRRTFLALPMLASAGHAASESGKLQAAFFNVDVTPPLGSPLCLGLCDPAGRIDDRLSARGLVLLSAGEPIVLCAIDWLGVSNLGHDEMRRRLALAASTSPERVAVHTLHQHDAPGYDPGAAEILKANGLRNELYDDEFMSSAIPRIAGAVTIAIPNAQPVTHFGIGRAKVERVASNRRILGPDGKVKHGRMSSCKVPEAIAAPEGTIDPYVTLLSLWNESKPLASITYYATHPQSYYCKGGVSADFVGAARALREADVPGVVHIHFNGAGGNVAAGKYNDGSPANRLALAARLAGGMRRAWKATKRRPISPEQVRWSSLPVELPAHDRLKTAELLAEVRNAEAPLKNRTRAARDLSWISLAERQRKILVQMLEIGGASVLHMPGELFVEYQLAAQKMNRNKIVAMAAYGDLGPGYIGTEISYGQGGYETGVVSLVSPKVEQVLMTGMRTLLAGSNHKAG